ncbi:MAG TPA: hypothetical protein VJL60_06000, partial [Gammaproteobacteria bacterium]|nr:hypothetical protein [Gammaproteobacteria bacterium]
RQYKTGSCEQRSIAAYDELLKQHPTARIVRNDVHAYVEVKLDNQWVQLELGGYPAKLNKMPMQIVEPKKTPVPPVFIARPQYPMTDVSSSDIKKKTETILVVADSDLDVKEFFDQYSPSDPMFVAHKPDDLSLTAAGMTQSGGVKTSYNKFNRWFKNQEHGTICVDIRDFNASELAQLNDLLDRIIEKEKLPKEMRIILIDRASRGEYGPDFRRRVPIKTTVKAKVDAKLLDTNAPPAADEKIVIDLFHSAYWQRMLIGSWQLKKNVGNSFSFVWQKGSLLEALEHGVKQIVFKNPPLKDPTFTNFIAELQSLKTLSWADQTTLLSPNVRFYQEEGYDWKMLSQHALLGALTNEDTPYVLSDANILAFIQDPHYAFSKESDQLTVTDCYLTRKMNTSINVVCSYGTSESTIAQLLSEAKKRNVHVRFGVPSLKNIKIPALSS